jgi:hypothetical protein
MNFLRSLIQAALIIAILTLGLALVGWIDQTRLF